MEIANYWIAAAPEPKRYRDHKLSDPVDCAVVGGGLTGLSAAYYLAREGMRVAVLEREHLGWGASSRNGGMGIPHIAGNVDALIREHGIETTRLMFKATVEANELVKELIAREDIECDLEESGSFAAAYRPSHFNELERWKRKLSEDFGHATRLVPPEHTREEVGTDRYYGGLIDETSIGLHPAKFVAGVARCAEEAGASLHEGTSVEEIRRTPNGFLVRTTKGNVRAKEIVIATNGYTGGVTPQLRRRVIPVASYIIVTEPLEKSLADRIIPNRRMVYDTKENLYYFRILPDNRMLFGGSPTLRLADTQRNGERLRKSMAALFPDLSNARAEYTWSGLVGMTFDFMPHMGEMNGLHYAMGYNGDGLTLSVYSGMKLAHVIVGKGEAPPFAQLGFRSMILYRRRPWFLPRAGAYFRIKDHIS